MGNTIKKKTELRKNVKNSIGNTASLDIVEFYSDFTWEIMSTSTFSNNCIKRVSLESLGVFDILSDKKIDEAITSNFYEIEEEIKCCNKNCPEMI